jgi:hypothetical protein
MDRSLMIAGWTGAVCALDVAPEEPCPRVDSPISGHLLSLRLLVPFARSLQLCLHPRYRESFAEDQGHCDSMFDFRSRRYFPAGFASPQICGFGCFFLALLGL